MSDDTKKTTNEAPTSALLDRRNLLLGTSTLVAAVTLTSQALAQAQKAAPATPSTAR